MISHENRLLADDSHETSYLIFRKLGKVSQNLSSAAVVIGALRVNVPYQMTLLLFSLRPPNKSAYVVFLTFQIMCFGCSKERFSVRCGSFEHPNSVFIARCPTC